VPDDRDRLAEARRLDAEAIEVGEDGDEGRDLRARAAALRVEALGPKAYPVLVCDSCFRLTAWKSPRGRCDACERREQVRAAFHDPHGGWVRVDDLRRPDDRPKPPSPARRLRRLVSETARDRALVASWLARVEPDLTGPVAPEEGYELEAAQRDRVAAADGSGFVVRFSTATERFHDGRWVELQTTRIAQADVGVPDEFPASLPVEQLVEAWGDYRAAVAAFNARRWAGEAERREAKRLADADRAEAIREGRDVLDYLDES